MSKAKLTIPCQWDINVIKKILTFTAKKDIEIVEMYGALSNGKLPQGREKSIAHHTTREEARKIKLFLESQKIQFAYLINTPINMQMYDELEEELEWIINVFKADSLTISSLELFRFIRKKYPTVRINVSTIAGIKTVADIEPYISLKPSKIIAHHDLNRNFDELTNVITFLKGKNIDFEIMLNESCLRRCPFREQHYDALGKGITDRSFHMKCNTIKIQKPYQLLMANFVRPEDLVMYENIGVKLFKITGRSKPIGWLEEVVFAYLNRQYNGNLFRLLGTDPILEVENKIYIANSALNGFLETYPKSGNISEEKNYCEQWINKLYLNKKFRVENLHVQSYLDKNNLRFLIEDSIY